MSFTILTYSFVDAEFGTIIIKTPIGKIKSFEVSIDVIEGKELPVFPISLPSLK